MIRHYTHAADSTSIAIEVIDCDHPDAHTIVFCNGLATDAFYFKYLIAHLVGRARLITWDYRGHGRSGAARDLDSISVAAMADDLRRVLDVTETARATLVGFSFGCQVVLEAWRHFPERIDAMILALGTFERPFDHVFHPRVGPKLFSVYKRLAPRLATGFIKLGSLGRVGHFGVYAGRVVGNIEPNIPAEDMNQLFEQFRVMDARAWAAMAIAAQDHSARDLLESITAPTLIVAGGKDTFTPAHMSEYMRDRIPNNTMLYLPRATHTGLLGHYPQINAAVRDFLDARGSLLG